MPVRQQEFCQPIHCNRVANGPLEISALLIHIAVDDAHLPCLYKMYTWASCSGESRNPTCLQTAGFEFLDCTAIKLKRPKVTGGEVGVSPTQLGLGL